MFVSGQYDKMSVNTKFN